jgi:cell wall-associated NlpC family hydrolase
VNTIGYLFILGALLLLNQVRKGRALQIGEDVSDAFLAAVRGDGAALKEVLSRTGDATTPPTAEPTAATPGTNGQSAFASGTGGAIGRAAVARGTKAKGYKFGATGPDYYDCSGLMWRACQDANAYPKSGAGSARFTTATIAVNPAFARVTTPAIDDIVCWTGKHMGVVTGPDTFYSAISVKSGIRSGKISAQRGFFKMDPVYYRAKTVMSASAGSGQGQSGGGGGSW